MLSTVNEIYVIQGEKKSMMKISLDNFIGYIDKWGKNLLKFI